MGSEAQYQADDGVGCSFVSQKLILDLTLLFLCVEFARADKIVTLTTPLGSFDIRMLEEDAPLTVENFLGYVERGDYDGTFIHRSVPGFIIQGGGYTFIPPNSAPHIDTQDPVVNEFGVSNTRGTVTMAKLGNDPNSATSEWFVNLSDNAENLDNQNGGFTVFGVVINDGMTVVDAIAALPTESFGGAFTDTPTINYTGSITEDIFVTIDGVAVTEVGDFDGDGMADNVDTDDDNDGVADTDDAFPFDAAEASDFDGDGSGDNADTDDDNDGVDDTVDTFPFDISEWVDSDSDGIGDNADGDNSTTATAYLLTTSTSANFTVLHVINSGSTPQMFTGTLYNGDGERLGDPDIPLSAGAITVNGRVLLTATDLESSFGVEAWSGPAMIEVKGTTRFDLMTKLTSPSGLVSNTNCVRTGRVHNIEGFDSENLTFIRLINSGDTMIEAVTGNLLDANGQLIGSASIELLSELAPKQAVWINRNELSTKFAAEWDGVASLVLESAPESLKLLNLNLVNNETFFNFSCFEDSSSGSAYLMTNSASANISETHIVNTSDEAIDVEGTVYAGTGEALGDAGASLVSGLVPVGGRLVVNAADLENLTTATTWSGPALVKLTGTGSFEVMTRLTSPSGLVSNTNCVRQTNVHNIEGFDSENLTFVRFINDGDAAIGNVSGQLYDLAGDQIGSGTVLIDSLQPFEARWLNRTQLSELFNATWDGEATLVVSAENSESLRLLNLNFVNEETFFNFSCYEQSR